MVLGRFLDQSCTIQDLLEMEGSQFRSHICWIRTCQGRASNLCWPILCSCQHFRTSAHKDLHTGFLLLLESFLLPLTSETSYSADVTNCFLLGPLFSVWHTCPTLARLAPLFFQVVAACLRTLPALWRAAQVFSWHFVPPQTRPLSLFVPLEGDICMSPRAPSHLVLLGVAQWEIGERGSSSLCLFHIDFVFFPSLCFMFSINYFVRLFLY